MSGKNIIRWDLLHGSIYRFYFEGANRKQLFSATFDLIVKKKATDARWLLERKRGKLAQEPVGLYSGPQHATIQMVSVGAKQLYSPPERR